MTTLLKTEHTEVVEVDGIEMIKRPVAVAILVLTPDDKILMVKQKRGSFGEILEVPAGKVDEGEDPEDAVRRELLEETGYRANSVKYLIDYYPSVGYSTEVIRCYSTEDVTYTGEQRLDDGERIKIVKLGPDEIHEKIRTGEIKDSKTLMCIMGGIFKYGV